MFSQAVRVSKRAPSCRTLLHQHLTARLASTDAAIDVTSQTKNRIRTAYVRSWRPVANIAEVWAIVRELEKRYGKVLETHFLKDFEEPSRYQMISWIVFASPESLQRVPEKGVELTIVPPSVPKMQHEISLSDLEPLSSSTPPEANTETAADRTPDPENKDDLLGFRIMRAHRDYLADALKPDQFFQPTSFRNMEHFNTWGGFSKLEPLDPPRVIREQDLFVEETVIDQNRMRAALQICSRSLRNAPPGQPVRRRSAAASAEAAPPVEEKSEGTVEESATAQVPEPEPSSTASASESAVDETPSETSTAEPQATPTTAQEIPDANTPPPPVEQATPSPPKQPTHTHEEAEALKRQMEVARQFHKPNLPPQPSPPVRRKQGKPKIKAPKEPQFARFGYEIKEEVVEEAPRGALSRIWGMFGKR